MTKVNKEFDDEPQGADDTPDEFTAYAESRYVEGLAGIDEAEREKAKAPIASALPKYLPHAVATVSAVENDDPETEIRYQANFLFWHYVAEVHVQIGEEYNMKLANRNAADIKGYLERGELIEYRAPINAPRVVFRAPDTLEWDGEREEWVTQTHWNEAYQQWGRREKRKDPLTGFDNDVWVFWSDEAKTQWAGETNFTDHNDYLGGK